MNKVTIYFGHNQKTPLPGQMGKLDPLVSVLAYPRTKVNISGHASTEGPPSYNLKLSKERAQFVESYLIKKGAQASQLKVSAYGEKRTAVREQAQGSALEAQRAKNRRVEVEFAAGEKTNPYKPLTENLRRRYKQAVDAGRRRLQRLQEGERRTRNSPHKVPAVLQYWQEEIDSCRDELAEDEAHLKELDTLEKLTSDPKKVWDVATSKVSIFDAMIRYQQENVAGTRRRLAEAQKELAKASDPNEKKFWKEMVDDYKYVLKEREEELAWRFIDKKRWLEGKH
jgi:hypothetical protein